MSQSSPSLGHRVLRGIEVTVLGNAASLAANLYFTPVLIRHLGTEGYALYALIATIQGYLLQLNLGTNGGMYRFVGVHRGDPARVSGVMWTSLRFQMAASVLGCAVLFAARSWLAESFFNIHGIPLAEVVGVLAWSAAIVPFAFLLQFASSALYGLERLAAYNAFSSLQAILVLLASAAMLASGHGILGVTKAVFAVHVVLAAGGMLALRASLGRPRWLTGGERREFFVYSLKTYVTQVLWQFSSQGDRLIIGKTLPLSQLGFYSICGSLAQKLNVFFSAVAATAFPIMTDLHGRGQEERFRRLYLKATELTLLVILPVSVLSFVVAPQFIGMWLGPEFGRASLWPFRLLVVANVGYVGSYLPQSVSLSRGAPGLHARLFAAKFGLLCVLWWLLIPRLGINGAALAMLIAEWVITPAYVLAVHRRFLNVSLKEYWDESCWRPLAAAGALAALILPTHHLIDGWIGLFAFCAGSSVLYLGFAYWLLDSAAKTLLHDWLGKKFKLAKSEGLA